MVRMAWVAEMAAIAVEGRGRRQRTPQTATAKLGGISDAPRKLCGLNEVC